MCGAGGGGGGGGAYWGGWGYSYSGGNGGNGAILFMKKITVALGESIAVTVGTKGIGGAAYSGEQGYSTVGSAGGTSSFGSYASCVGGGGGGAAYVTLNSDACYNWSGGASYSADGLLRNYGYRGAGGYGSNAGSDGQDGIVIVITL